jgi:MSHA biogenesis protein MshE
MRKKIRIGELLVKGGIITEEQLQIALDIQKSRGRKMGQMLIELGFVDENRLLEFLAEQLQVPWVDLRKLELSEDIVSKLPETHARRFRALVIEDSGKALTVAMADPSDIFAVDELSRILRCPVQPAVVRESDLLAAIDRLYRRTEEISHLAEELGDELSESEVDLGAFGIEEDATDAPVVRLLHSLFEDAVQMKASDIHIEPDEDVIRLRQRIDGVLHEHVMKETRIASALVLRLKLMSGLDISEKRLPQDGRFNVKVKGRNIDVRISTMPIQCGESVVMRLLDQSGEQLSLDQLGLPAPLLEELRRSARRPHGLILVTGPTGSGKTTTLYGVLRELNDAEKKVITVEEPVEYRLPRINQVQVNPKIDLTFATVLRAALRQDPDILMVGEMRDQETTEIALRAAMTGHLVLSTLHTNDAVASGLRLIDMGAEGYLVAAALRTIVAQRLVRRICSRCREPHEPTDPERLWLTEVVGPKEAQHSFQRGRGCTDCNGTGYSGRIGVYELLQLDGAMADALRRNDHADFARAAQSGSRFHPLRLSALEYARDGITSLSEVLRVAEGLAVAGDVRSLEDRSEVPASGGIASSG